MRGVTFLLGVLEIVCWAIVGFWLVTVLIGKLGEWGVDVAPFPWI